MRKQYLLLGAASMLMLAACSEDLKGPETNGNASENTLNLKSLSPASQAGRVSLPGETRGPKADRLQLVAKIAPVVDDDAINKNWSATGITIANGNAYVSWHSNHQATVAAQNWGGAIDMIDINALVNGQKDGALTGTLVSQAVKFNNIVAVEAGNIFYLPITSYTNGAAVGRWTRGSLAMDTIALPGSSANSVKIDGNDLYAVTGYAGGLFKVNADFNVEGVENVIDTIVEPSADFGGKYIAGDYYLRTNDEKSQIVNLNGTVRNEGAPLLSEEKFAEAYDPANGEWYPLTGETARHYGKHTMAIDGNYIYVGGGQGSNGENGLRVYAGTGLVWQNGTNTTAVTVAEVGGKKYVFAATGAGLRVYEPYDSSKDSLPLYAMEVLDYDDNGNAADHEGMNQPQAGTDAHSSNFVAVDETSGLIFVACGQSGVYVFKLQDVVAKEWPTGFQWPNGSNVENITDETGKFEVPEAPVAPEGKEFVGWKGDDGKDYTAGQEVELPAGKVVVLTPDYKDKVVEKKYTLKFDYFDGQDREGTSNLPAVMESATNDFEIPATVPVWGERNFVGWSTTPAFYDYEDPSVLKAGDHFQIPGDAAEFTLYGVWSSPIEGGIGTEEPTKPSGPTVGGEDTNGKQ